MVGLNGLEPSTSALSEQRSNQLSYRPINGGGKGNRTLDPLRARQVLSQLSYIPLWWTFRDSNPGPTGYEPVALTS